MPGSPVDLSNSFGAAFIGFLVSVGLFGLGIGQTWMYFWNYWDKDKKALKSFIAFLAVVDTLHVAIVTYGLYWYMVLNFNNLEALAANMWVLNVQGIIGGIGTAAVELYYARQIYLCSLYINSPTSTSP